MKSVTAATSLDGLLLNGHLIRSPREPAEYAAILEAQPRIIEPLSPAPYGHRNNQIHLFDHHGLYLIEHHARMLIDSIVFVLWFEESTFKPAQEFAGELTVGGVRFLPGMTERDYRDREIEFDGPILGLWSASRSNIWIGLRSIGIRQPNGRRGKRRRFVEVSVGFEKGGK